MKPGRFIVIAAMIATGAHAKWTPFQLDSVWTHYKSAPIERFDGFRLGLGTEHRDFLFDQILARKSLFCPGCGLHFVAASCTVAPPPDICKNFAIDPSADFSRRCLCLRDTGSIKSISGEKAAMVLNPSFGINPGRKNQTEEGNRPHDAVGLAAAQLLDHLQAQFSDLATGDNLQTHLVNLSRENLSGAQIGLVNAASDWKGLQLGLVTRGRRGTGLQIGLVNIADAKTAVIAPVVFSLRF